jgi:cell division protease FtsH
MRGILAWAVILAMLLLMLHFYMKRQDTYDEIPYYPKFVQYVESGRIAKCEIVREVSGVEYIKGKLLPGSGEHADAPGGKFKVYITQADEDLKRLLIDHGVEFHVPPQNPYLYQVLSSVLPVVLIFGLLYFLFMRQIRAAGHGAMSFGKSRAKQLNRENNKVTFENVAGIDEAREEVEEIIDFLKDPKRFQTLGGRIPKGVLLMGPPGTGKTLLAKAIAGEAGVPFFSISGSDFVEMFVGVGASRVRDMFDQGKKNAPCIIFIDEIDAVGRSRFTGIGGGHDEREQTLNALLVEMDGFDTQEGVIILAATNRPDVLDQALLRPGRFDRQIVIDLPMIDGREQILRIHSKKIKLKDDKDLRRIARGTSGFSGADLENLLNEAALLAAREDKAAVELRDLEEARDKVMWGRERRSRVMDDREKKTTAYHEAGHALVQQVCAETEPLHKVTIIPRGFYLGATMSLPEKDQYNQSRVKLLSQLAVLMGGRSAEEVEFDDITTGAQGDIREVTRLARLMVCNWGMSDLGPQRFGENQEIMFLGREVSRNQDFSEDTARKIDAEISRLVKEAHDRARAIVTERRDQLKMIAERLLERETIDGRDVEEIVEHGRILSEEERDKLDAEKAGAEESEGPPPAESRQEQAAQDESPADGAPATDKAAENG